MKQKDDIKVYVVGGDIAYANVINKPFKIVTDMNLADVIIFTGGADVDPDFYGQEIGQCTNYDRKRDLFEAREFREASKRKRLLLGICRGAQFLTVMNEGILIQHVTNHGVSKGHEIFVPTENRSFNITSTHHQMMYPFNLDDDEYVIIAYSKNLSDTYLDGYDSEMIKPNNFVEPEIVYYPKTNSLCIQGHPEYMPKNSDAVRFINGLIDELIEDKSNYVIVENEKPAPIDIAMERLRNELINVGAAGDMGLVEAVVPIEAVRGDHLHLGDDEFERFVNELRLR